MQQTELKHLQQVLLYIIKDIDKLCTLHGIEYYLTGGSALGAIRHRGFIPWDDDLDILMTSDNYKKFCHICKTELDTQKYYFQEGLIDWHLNFSKIRLKGTYMEEVEADYSIAKENRGIFVDIFKLDNVSSSKWKQFWQYFCAKVWLSYMLGRRTYQSASGKQKRMMFFANILSIPAIKKFFHHQVERYDNCAVDYYGLFFGRTRFHNSIMKREVYGHPVRVPFEDIELPVPEKVHEHLIGLFGNYMQLPPEEKRRPIHTTGIDFGKY
jgi:lipopolysaccharide cholinephosphotransferase